MDLRRTFPAADLVKVASGRQVVVFNIGGNSHRLIAAVHFNTGVVFDLAVELIHEYERRSARPTKPLPLPRRLSGLLEAHGMTAAELAKLVDLEPSMGSKIRKGTRRLTVPHIRKLAKHFGLPADYFLAA